jgi:hypothetical protein
MPRPAVDLLEIEHLSSPAILFRDPVTPLNGSSAVLVDITDESDRKGRTHARYNTTVMVVVETEKGVLDKFAEFEDAGDELGDILQGGEIVMEDWCIF